MISIVDYGMGNLRSVEKALEKLGFEAHLVSTPEEVGAATKLILPGVGAFGDAMRGLDQRGLIEPIRSAAASGTPIMGICLGMQIFFDSSEEDPGVAGLSLIPGTVRRFRTTELKVPHMGWNDLADIGESKLLANLGPSPYVYFVHSYFVVPENGAAAAAFTTYGERFVSAVETENICGTQFHPEKSQAIGMKILRNFAEIREAALSQ